MKFLLDTSALLAHHRQEAGWEKVQALFEDEDAEILIASVTVTEFARRMRELGASDEEVLATLESYRLTFAEVVAVDETVARIAFEIGRQTPARLPLADALIAGAARAKNAALVHRDKHLSAIPAAVLPALDLEL